MPRREVNRSGEMEVFVRAPSGRFQASAEYLRPRSSAQ